NEIRQNQIPCEACQCDGGNRCGFSSRKGQIGRIGKHDIRSGCPHGGHFLLESIVPCCVESFVSPPGRLHIDIQRSLLNAADVLLGGTEIPGHQEAIFEK